MLARYEPPGASRESAGALVVIFLLLVVIAILLFGSSVVLGVVGIVVGFLVACVALIKALALFGLTLEDALLPACLGFLFIALIARLWFGGDQSAKPGMHHLKKRK